VEKEQQSFIVGPPILLVTIGDYLFLMSEGIRKVLFARILLEGPLRLLTNNFRGYIG